MGKSKGARIIVTLECICPNISKIKWCISLYYNKNRRNTPEKIKLKKYCPNCNCHSLFQEIK
uniref:Ribosomal protein L33 n=1 Tax=Hildenbrandia rubra TaxID=31481 RepID=A0A1C9CFX4_9FLOR|nr:ribosomal protein L33 [Hildenbrandia rubra]AOM67279.1 ribosomal protein L33 [Hildenbrandia rubra]